MKFQMAARDKMPSQPDAKPRSAGSIRKERLAAALRANLVRRKQQSRERDAEQPYPGGSVGTPKSDEES
jgi:hypothetical protein